MVIFKGEKLVDDDKALIRRFVTFVLETLIFDQADEHIRITINFLHPKNVSGEDKRDLIEYKAWMVRNSENSFTITINVDQVKQYPNQIARLRNVFLCLGHELVHVKQYVTGQMQDITATDCMYMGKIYNDCNQDNANYWLAPWEIESYGHEQGLFALFKKQITKKDNSSVV